MTESERYLAIREGHFNAASDEYFEARSAIDTPDNRRIFYGGHCKGYDKAVDLMREAEEAAKAKQPTNALQTFGYNDKGEVTLRASRTTFDPGKDHNIAECALMFREAVVVRGQTNIDPFVLWKHIMGREWEVPPIDMLLYCPNCGVKHVDKDNSEELSIKAAELGVDREGDRAYSDWLEKNEWTNPPHRTHLCHSCGCTWRPADVPTNGVDSIKTEGKNDSWPAQHNEEVTAAKAVAKKDIPRCACCGTTKNLHADLGSGGPYRCDSDDCMVF